MDFRFSEADEAFRQEVRDFIATEVPPEFRDGRGSEGEADAAFGAGRQIQRKLAQRRWLAMAWPEEYGGLAASHFKQHIFNHEIAYHAVPGGFSMGVAWVGPAIMLYGTDEQKRHYLPRISNADDFWCTLYSEPGAGSDLASLQTRAVLDGDTWVVNGQKIWTSQGHRATHGWLAARTDPEAPKHKGISTFVMDMKAPGITIQPLVNLAGDHGFNQIFFDNVRIPSENIVGEVNRGWYHVAVALDFERSSVPVYANCRRALERYVDFARKNSDFVKRDPGLRLQLADRALEMQVGYNLSYRIVWMQSAGRVPNYEASVAKVFGSELVQRIARTGMALVGTYGLLRNDPHAPMGGRASHLYLDSTARTIGAGTSEVQRNIIATRGLGLPRG
jgi:alkylation response protein AidB-like acyl-CoA dehydrogenase